MIVLLTDFGLKDFFVGQMKGVIECISPNCQINDLTHFVEPCNIKHGQYFLQFSYKYFQENTIFCAVIDPGVGTERKAIAVKFENRWFVGPDNGLFSFAETGEVYEIIFDKNKLSSTFHGRDIFAKTSAEIANGNFRNLKKVNKLNIINKIKLLDSKGSFECEILNIDRFGNLITNVSNSKFKNCEFYINNKKINTFSETFETSNKELFIIKGSCELLEIVSNKKSAANLTGLKINDYIKVEIK